MSRPTIAAAAAQGFLADRFRDDVEMGPDLPQGEWSHAYSFTLNGRDYVVRFNPSRDAFDLDLLAMKYGSPSVPIPHVIEVGEAFGGFYAVSERAFGGFLEELGPEDLEDSVHAILSTLDAMRSTDLSDSVGFGPWTLGGDGRYANWGDYLLDVEREAPEPSRDGWREQLDASPLARAAFETGLQALSELVGSCPQDRHLLHSDMLNRNVFVANHRVEALIDWQCAMYGDFLYELAWFTFWAPWYLGLSGIDFRQRALERYEQIGLGVPAFDERMRCYETHIGLRHLVYNAWRGDLSNLDATANRTAGIVRG